jgi:hypothetical protein
LPVGYPAALHSVAISFAGAAVQPGGELTVPLAVADVLLAGAAVQPGGELASRFTVADVLLAGAAV